MDKVIQYLKNRSKEWEKMDSKFRKMSADQKIILGSRLISFGFQLGKLNEHRRSKKIIGKSGGGFK